MTGNSERQIPDEEWAVIVRNVPIVSVDLVALSEDGIVLGKRSNRPAKGEWFVPGGTVFKHESLESAVHRIADLELGCGVTIDRRLGVYEHRYDTADVADANGKHYVAVAFVVTPSGQHFIPDEQHSEIRTFSLPVAEGVFHRYVMRYLRDIDAVTSS